MDRHQGGARLVSEVEAIMPDAAGVPAYALDVAHPTTIGLGDSFVAGFLSAYA